MREDWGIGVGGGGGGTGGRRGKNGRSDLKGEAAELEEDYTTMLNISPSKQSQGS